MQDCTFRDQATGDEFRIRFEWHRGYRRGLFHRVGPHYRLFVEVMPPCGYALGRSAHLLAQNEICVTEGREPQTLDRAKAIAMFWLRGFGAYRRTGAFPNDGGKVNVVET